MFRAPQNPSTNAYLGKKLTIYKPDVRAIPLNTKIEVLKYGPSLRGPCVKSDGLVFHGTEREIRLINSLFSGKNENIQYCSPNYTKLIFPMLFVDFQIIRKLSENSPRIFRKITAQEFHRRRFPEFYNFRKFSENFETILVDVLFSN